MDWRYSINIKQYINQPEHENVDSDDLLPESIRSGILAELRKLPVERIDANCSIDTLSDLIKCMNDSNDIRTVEDFNDWLGNLYDMADNQRIWLGP